MQVTLDPSGVTIELPDKIGDLAKAFSSGMMDDNELKILAAASTLVPVFPQVIAVEIGTYVGATAVFLATVLRELGREMPILSIDAFSRVQSDALNPQAIYSLIWRTLRHTRSRAFVSHWCPGPRTLR